MADDNPNPIPAVRNALQPMWLAIDNSTLHPDEGPKLRKAFDRVIDRLAELETAKGVELDPKELKRAQALAVELGFEAGGFTNWPKLIAWSLRLADQFMDLHTWAADGGEDV